MAFLKNVGNSLHKKCWKLKVDIWLEVGLRQTDWKIGRWISFFPKLIFYNESRFKFHKKVKIDLNTGSPLIRHPFRGWISL